MALSIAGERAPLLSPPRRHPADLLREEQERRPNYRWSRRDNYYSPEDRDRRPQAMWRGRGGRRDNGRGDQGRVRRPGYGELCRHLHRNLRRAMDDHKAYGVSDGNTVTVIYDILQSFCPLSSINHLRKGMNQLERSWFK